jgi:prepilin-type N-terminal cleavage/methylation domain-containing protein
VTDLFTQAALDPACVRGMRTWAATEVARERDPCDGFALVEILISLLLLSIASVGALAMMITTMRAGAFAGGAQTATRLAQEVVDAAMTESFATLGSSLSICASGTQSSPYTFGGGVIYATNQATSGGTAAFTAYSRSCYVAPLGSGLKLISVSISWKEPSGRARSLTVGSTRAP